VTIKPLQNKLAKTIEELQQMANASAEDLDPAAKQDLEIALRHVRAVQRQVDQPIAEAESGSQQMTDQWDQARTLAVLLERERELLHNILEHTHVQLVYLDAEMRFVHANPAYIRSSGLDWEALLGRNHFELFPNPENQAIFEHTRDTGQPVSFQAKPFVYPNAPERGLTYWDWSLVPVKDESGTVRGLVFSLIDVTEREESKRLLAQREQEYLALVEHNPDVILRFDRNHRCLYANPAAEEALEDTPCHALVGHTLKEWVLPRELVEKATQDFDIVLESGQPRTMHFTTSGPRPRSYETRLVPEFGPDGAAASVLAIARDVTARERSRALLEGEKARLDAIIENVPEAIVVTDEKARILRANAAAERIYKRPIPYGADYASHRELRLRRPDGTLYDPRQLPLTRSALDGETLQGIEMTVRWPDGQIRNLTVNAAPIRDPSGDITGAVGTFQDVTDSKAARIALERYAQRLQALHEMDQAILAARSTAEIGRIALGYVEQFLKPVRSSVVIFDVEKSEISFLAVAGKATSSLPAGWRGPLRWAWYAPKLLEGDDHVTRSLNEIEADNPLKLSLQEAGVNALISIPVALADQIIGALNIGLGAYQRPTTEEVDIMHEIAAQLAIGLRQAMLTEELELHATELEHMVARRTAALQDSEARFRAIFNESALGIALVNLHGQLIITNPALRQILGYSGEELAQLSLRELTYPEDASVDEGLLRQVIQGELSNYQAEKRFVDKTGQPVPVSLTVSRIQHAEGLSTFAVLLMEDITERKEAEATLIQAEKLAVTGRLAASLTHEINNPLQSVIGCLSLSKEIAAEGENVTRYIDVAHAEVRRAADIVSRLRDLNKPTREADQIPTNLSELMDQVLLVTEKRRRDRHITLHWSPPPDLPKVPIVPDRIRQVYLNLVLNALDAMSDEGELTIEMERTTAPAGVRTLVQDNGVGIPEDRLARLFEPFASKKAQGMGLGLYVSNNIVEQHEGQISVETELGQGTTFSVWLPMES
jgi:PAS domain S-box-containing protein